MKKLIYRQLMRHLPRRARDANKFDFGHVAVVGGNYGMGGAALLAGLAAAMTGAGVVRLLIRPEYVSSFTAAHPSLQCNAIQDTTDLRNYLNKATVIILGPGLGQDDWAQQLYKTALTYPVPTVIDADALRLLALQPQHHPHWILTPHVGEAAQLLGQTAGLIQKDRVRAVETLQTNFGGVAV